MSTIREPCRKCAYVRRPGDTAPEWQCPSCGVAYTKVVEFEESQLRPATPYIGAYYARQDRGIAWGKWFVVAVIAVTCAAGYNGMTKKMSARSGAEPVEPPASSASAPLRVGS